MDAKITKKRLNDRLSYDWIKVIAVTLLVTLLWGIVYSMTGVKLTNGEEFNLLIVTDTYSSESAEKFTKKLEESGRFSYGIQNVLYEYLGKGDYYDSMELMIRLSEAEMDIAIFSDDATRDENGNLKADDDGYLKISAFRNFVDKSAVWDFDSAIAAAYDYLRPFYKNGDLSDARVMDEQKVAANFRNNKLDNRFRTEAQITAGIELEKQRLEGYLKETRELEAFLAAHPETVISYAKNALEKEVDLYRHKGEDGYESAVEVGEVKRYGIDLSYFPNAAELCASQGGTTKDCVLTILNYYGRIGDLFFESFAAINYFLETYTTS